MALVHWKALQLESTQKREFRACASEPRVFFVYIRFSKCWTFAMDTDESNQCN